VRILMPSRILDRHTGGNTTYARHIADGLTRRGIPVGRIPARSHPVLTMLQETATGLQRGTAGDLLHYTADTGPLVRTKRPSIVSVHGVASRWISDARNSRQEKIWRTRVQRAIDSTDHVITVSNSSANDVHEVFGVERSRLTTIEHGIDVPLFSTHTELSDEVRAQVPDQFVLYLGNIEPRKNLLPLVEAFALPEMRALGVKLVIAGKAAWNSDESLAAIDASRDVIRLGFVSDDDRRALMQSCVAFAFPSLYEGFGFPVVEALAAGAVVVTSSRGSLEEVAGPSIRFESLSPEGIASGLVTAITDEQVRAACLDAGLAWASHFTWDASVDKHVEVYKKVLG